MYFTRVLIANRGEIAIRIARTAQDLGIASVAVHSSDDAASRHVTTADVAVGLTRRGPAAYLDAEAIIGAARAEGCDAIHPGYGFLAESPVFADACARAGITFVGPAADTLARLGDKVEARRIAEEAGVPILRGTREVASAEAALAFFASLGGNRPIVLKAVAGGGGRGMRVVRRGDEIEGAFARCESEARAAFGDGRLYAEEFLAGARHVEVQILADAQGGVGHLWERECSLQRRHQKLIERAPATGLDEVLRQRILEAAMVLARATGYLGIGTFEFLVAGRESAADGPFVFIEANPRLQVEHTVTEAVTGIDLVRTQFALAAGATLRNLGLDTPPPVRGAALQARVNLETMGADGAVRPTGGTLRVFEPPTGPGVRTDTYATAGYTTNPAFDSLIAKVIVHDNDGDAAALVRRARRAVGELRIEGVATNREFLLALLDHPDVASGRYDTEFIERHIATLRAAMPAATAVPTPTLAGSRLRSDDPLAVLTVARTAAPPPTPPPPVLEAGEIAVPAPLQGTVIVIAVEPGQVIHAGAELAVMEAMKMEHVVAAPCGGRVRSVDVAVGDTVFEGHSLLVLVPEEVTGQSATHLDEIDLDRIRPDLAEVIERHAMGSDARRPAAVARRHARGQRTARENIADLVDPGTFVEYGALQIAAQRRRRSVEELIEKTPADGMVAGIGRVNGALFPGRESQCVVMSYDYTVLAGTQGHMNHLKKDRMFELAENNRLPLILFAEGGGGRPGDTDGTSVAGLDCYAFNYFARLSGLVPLVGITSGYCFAGNAALLGCCDVVIATEGSNIGMGGPAMIEGGGLGVFRPDEVGPLSVQVPNGVVDLVAKDEREAVALARRYIGYFQGPLGTWSAPDQRRLRHLIPENRVRIYDVRRVIDGLVDDDSLLELRRGFGHGMITALARIEGRPLGIVANNPAHLGGAIDADGADKATRFMQLCDAFDLPLLFLCDTPGFMVGPEAEKTAQVRRFARMFVNGANLSVPFFTIILRKGYGLGAQAMAGGGFKIPLFTIAWPTGEFGGMGLEGAVKLGYRKELEALTDPAERKRTFEQMVERMYRVGKGVNVATTFEIDDVIDPAESRLWIGTAMRSAPTPAPREGKKRPCVDTW
jgi:acetyl/propionyl-CoA carboxylase alpha subunit/acetyl-CoA carboxylase carboxyltransferase component